MKFSTVLLFLGSLLLAVSAAGASQLRGGSSAKKMMAKLNASMSSSSQHQVMIATSPQAQRAAARQAFKDKGLELASTATAAFVTDIYALTRPSCMTTGDRRCDGHEIAENVLNKIGKPVISAAVGMIPGVGPILSAFISMLWPGENAPSAWDQVQAQVESQVGGAIRGVQLAWVSDQFRAAKYDFNILEDVTECYEHLPSKIDDVASALRRLKYSVKLSDEGVDPMVVAGLSSASGERASLRRAMLGYLPNVSILHILALVDKLEYSWSVSPKFDNVNFCKVALQELDDTIDEYIEYAKHAIDEFIAWIPCDDGASCDGKAFASVHSTSGGSASHEVVTLKCGPSEGRTTETRSFRRRHSSTRGDILSFKRHFEVKCANKQSEYLTKKRNEWTKQLLEPLGTWKEFAIRLSEDTQNYCTQMGQRGTPFKREKMGTKTFIKVKKKRDSVHNKCLNRGFNDCWKLLDEARDCSLGEQPPSQQPSQPPHANGYTVASGCTTGNYIRTDVARQQSVEVRMGPGCQSGKVTISLCPTKDAIGGTRDSFLLAPVTMDDNGNGPRCSNNRHPVVTYTPTGDFTLTTATYSEANKKVCYEVKCAA